MTEPRTVAVVGAGLAGAKAVEALRAEGFGGRIVLFGEEPHRPYERPRLILPNQGRTAPEGKQYPRYSETLGTTPNYGPS